MLHKSLQKRFSKATQKPSRKLQATRSFSSQKSPRQVPSKSSISSTLTISSTLITSLPKSLFTISSRSNSTSSYSQAPSPPPQTSKSPSPSTSQRRFVPRSSDSSTKSTEQKFEKKTQNSGTHLQFSIPAPPQTDRKKFQQWLIEREKFCWQHDPNCRATTTTPSRLNIINKKNYLHMISLVRDGRNDDLSRWLEINVSSIELNAQDFFGSTPLCTVAKKHLYGTLKTLIKYGADVNYASSSGTPLMHAAATLDLPIMQALLEHGANPNLGLKSTGQTPLMIASAQSNVAYPLLLLDHQADINAQDISGRTALMFAVRKGTLQMMTMLLDRGAQIEITDDYGFTALHYAKALPHEDENRGPKCMVLDKFNEKDGEKKVTL